VAWVGQGNATIQKLWSHPPKKIKKEMNEEDRNTSACGQIFIVRNKETQMTTF
jgi:hypothetical protein